MQNQIDLINTHNEAQDRRMDSFDVRQNNQDIRLNGLESDVDRIVNASAEENLEVVQARGSFETLGKRLDASDVKVTDLEAYNVLLDERLKVFEGGIYDGVIAPTVSGGLQLGTSDKVLKETHQWEAYLNTIKGRGAGVQVRSDSLFEVISPNNADSRFVVDAWGHVKPGLNGVQTLGTAANRWLDGYINNLTVTQITGNSTGINLVGDVVSNGAVYGIGTRRTYADGHTSRMMASTVSGEVVWGVAPNSNADVTSYIRIGNNKLQFINGSKVENIARTATYDVATLDEDGKTFLDRLIDQVQDQEERLAVLEAK